MEVIRLILIMLGVVAVCDALTHWFAEIWYKNHPNADKTAYFDTLDLIFRHKYVRPAAIILGIVCAAVGIML
ncbi:MAG: hypothetical protein IJZ72_07575 [Oscillospiraceae bacterium]|nr:hypothetical protein [Oscillospiraceae bacterium]